MRSMQCNVDSGYQLSGPQALLVYAAVLHSTQGIGTVNVTLLYQVMQDFRQRLCQCIECHGGLLELVTPRH
jgi:hypothetical protein